MKCPAAQLAMTGSSDRSAAGVDPEQRSVRILLDWLEGMYHPEKAQFNYEGKPVSKMSLREDGATPRVLKHRLYHVIEDDWLTYHATRIESRFLHVK